PSHGPGAHEFNAGVQLLAKCLNGFPGLETSVNLNGWPKSQAVFDGAAGILIYADGGAGHPAIQRDRLQFLGGLMNKGVGLMCAHFGVEVPKDKGGKEFQDWIGGYYEDKWSCNPIWRPEFKEFPKHPIAHGLKPFSAEDEWYFNMRFRPEMKGVMPILTAVPPDQVRDGPYVYPKGPYKHIQETKGRPEHMMWAVERADGGRGAGFTGGHFHHNWKNDNFRKAVLNALVWICKRDVPGDGVESTVTDAEIKQNLDPKPQKK
ncbi:MAG: ThuA domain-containing protein, partial [Zavarzinella sp.]|nr:ThuA domain-containing protein [Zavarzinella sp.]